MSKPNITKPAPRRRTPLFWLVALVVILLAGALFMRPYLQSAGNRNPGTVLRISMGGWQPNVVYAKAGQPLTVSIVNLDNSLHSDGGGWHNFVLEGQGIDQRIAPEQTGTFSFTLKKPGEYLFYCDICCGGKDNPFMRGKVVVEG